MAGNNSNSSKGGCYGILVVLIVPLIVFLSRLEDITDTNILVFIVPIVMIVVFVTIIIAAALQAKKTAKKQQSRQQSSDYIRGMGTRSYDPYKKLPGQAKYYSPADANRVLPDYQAGHLCDDGDNHSDAFVAEDIDMVKSISIYSYSQIDSKQFERPLSEEQRESWRATIVNLYKSGIIGADEYNYKLTELAHHK